MNSPDELRNHLNSIYEKLDRLSRDVAEIKTYASIEAKRYEEQQGGDKRRWVFRMVLLAMGFIAVLVLIFKDQFLPFLAAPAVQGAAQKVTEVLQ